MKKYTFVSFYLALIFFSLARGAVDFYIDKENTLAIIGGIFSILFFAATIGSFKGIKKLLWLGIICVSSYSLYAIGTVIWGLFLQPAQPGLLFLVFFVTLFTLVNIHVIFQMKDRLYNMKFKSHGK